MGGDPRIALDVRPFDLPGVSGQGRYVRDLVRGLAALALPARFTLVVGATPPPDFPIPDGWSHTVLPLGRGRGAHTANRVRTGLGARFHGCDLVHTLHTYAPWPRPRRHVYTVYDLMIDRFPEYAAVQHSRSYRQFRRAVRRADRVIAISAATAADLRALWGLSPDRIAVVPLAQDAASWAPSGHAETPDPTILSPYNLEPRKNLAALLAAFVEVRRALPAARLVLFGRAAVTPEREQAFEALLATTGCTDAVTRTGILSDADLAAWYRQAHVFAFPSLYEGFGLPLLEAMHAGGVVVSHPSPAAHEVLGSAGVFADAAAPAAFATAISGLLADPARRSSLRDAARTCARTRDTMDVARDTWACYRAALGGVT